MFIKIILFNLTLVRLSLFSATQLDSLEAVVNGDYPQGGKELKADSIVVDSLIDEIALDLLNARMNEAKMIYADAIIADMTCDTLEAVYQFDLLFDALGGIESISGEDEFQILEFNQFLAAAINYYEKKSTHY